MGMAITIDTATLLAFLCLKPCKHSLGVMAMRTFFVEIKCQLGRTYEVASALAEAEIASEIYSIAGDFDVLAKFYVNDDVDIGHFVGEKVQSIPGIANTRTVLTYRAF